MGYFLDGGYAEYTRAYADYTCKVPAGVNPLEAAPPTCAGVTTYKAVKMSGAQPSQLVAIFGKRRPLNTSLKECSRWVHLPSSRSSKGPRSPILHR